MRDPENLWRDVAYRFARQSKCRSRQVGCVLVSPEQRLIGQGFNGAPCGSSCETCPRCQGPDRPSSGQSLEKAICAHAEANAIGYAARSGVALSGSHLYCTTRPCLECAKLIVAAGIKAVFYFEPYAHPEQETIAEVFRRANIQESHVKN